MLSVVTSPAHSQAKRGQGQPAEDPTSPFDDDTSGAVVRGVLEHVLAEEGTPPADVIEKRRAMFGFLEKV